MTFQNKISMLGILAVLGVSVIAATQQPPSTTISCFVGHIMARDTATEHPTFMIRALQPPEVRHDTVIVPIAPEALVCARFVSDGTSAAPSSSAALKISD